MSDCTLLPIIIIIILVILALIILFPSTFQNLTGVEPFTDDNAVQEHFRTYGSYYPYGHAYWNPYYARYPWTRNYHRYLTYYQPYGYPYYYNYTY